MRSGRLRDAISEWDFEVEYEAARLIEGGMPPCDAMPKAVETVSAKRRAKARAATQETSE